MIDRLIGLVPRRILLWGAAIVGGVTAVAAYLWRRDARIARGERDRIAAATLAQELSDRRLVDDVEADVAGLDDRERRDRLRRWARNQDGRLRGVQTGTPDGGGYRGREHDPGRANPGA